MPARELRPVIERVYWSAVSSLAARSDEQRKSCDGERLPKDKLEAAILHQLTGLYRDGGTIRNAIEQAAASDETDRTALTQKSAPRSPRDRPRRQGSVEPTEVNANRSARLPGGQISLDSA